MVCTTLRTCSVGPAVTTALPLNSEVSPPSVAVELSAVPSETPPGAVMRKLNLLVLSVPWAQAVDVGGPIRAGGGIEIRSRAFGEQAQVGQAFAKTGRIRLRDVQLDGAAGTRKTGERQLAARRAPPR